MNTANFQCHVDVVGSFLPPDYLIEAKREYEAGVIDSIRYTKTQDEAVRQLIENQIESGLTDVTSGEFRRNSWDKDFWFGLNGICRERVDSGRIYQSVESVTDLLRVSGRVAYNPNHPFFDDFVFLRDTVAGRVKCRQTLPSPANLLLEIYNITEGKTEELYSSVELLVNDIAEAYNRTILHFHELGCDSILLDDTACGLMCDAIYTKRLLQGGVDLIELHRHILRVINASLVNIPKDMETSIYLSGGDKIVPEWEFIKFPDNIMPEALSTLNVDKFFLPFDTDNNYEFEILRHVPDGKKVVLGLIDAHCPFSDDTDSVKGAIRKAEEYISPSCLAISPRTGFKLSSYQSRGLTYGDQWHKLNAIRQIFNR